MSISNCPICVGYLRHGGHVSAKENTEHFSDPQTDSKPNRVLRGRGRKRSTGQRSSLKCTAGPSSSHSRYPAFRPTISKLRGSARLAELANQEPLVEDVMTDIVHRTFHVPSIGASSVGVDLGRHRMRKRTRRTRAGDDKGIDRWALNGNFDQNNFSLDPVNSLPREVRVGFPLAAPFTVRVDGQQQSPYTENLDAESGRLMAVATLVASDQHGLLTPVNAGILAGPQLADTVHPESSTGTLGYVSFPDLVIRSPGTFRVRVTLLRMSATVHAEHCSLQGAMSLASIDSEPVVVAGY